MHGTELQVGRDYTGVTVTFFCHDGNGHALMALRGPNCRDEHNRWDIGAGAVEYGQSPEETLCREILEEYGIEVKSEQLTLLGTRSVLRADTHWIALDYAVQLKPEAYSNRLQINGEPNQLLAVEWFDVGQYPDNVHSQFPVFLDAYAALLPVNP